MSPSCLQRLAVFLRISPQPELILYSIAVSVLTLFPSQQFLNHAYLLSIHRTGFRSYSKTGKLKRQRKTNSYGLQAAAAAQVTNWLYTQFSPMPAHTHTHTDCHLYFIGGVSFPLQQASPSHHLLSISLSLALFMLCLPVLSARKQRHTVRPSAEE